MDRSTSLAGAAVNLLPFWRVAGSLVRARGPARIAGGQRRGTDAAALDTAGASLGSMGLAAFGLSVWLLAPSLLMISLAPGSVAWLLVSVSLWRLRRELRIVRR